MSNKRISLSGVLLETTIQRSHTKTSGTPDSLLFTAQELAQMIASGVDSTGLAKYQAINELVVLTPSFVNENYADRGKAADASVSENGTVSALIPLSFSARGRPYKKIILLWLLHLPFQLPKLLAVLKDLFKVLAMNYQQKQLK